MSIVLTPEGFWVKTILPIDSLGAEREVIGWMYVNRPKHPMKYNHFALTERNAEIVRRRASGETLAELAAAYGLTQQRISHIVARFGPGKDGQV